MIRWSYDMGEIPDNTRDLLLSYTDEAGTPQSCSALKFDNHLWDRAGVYAWARIPPPAEPEL